MQRKQPLRRKATLRATALKRSNEPLARKLIERKPRKHDNPAVRHAYRETHQRCALCGFRAGQFGGWLEVAHILGGRYRRIDDVRNLLMLCVQTDGHSCHRFAEPIARFGLLLTLKRDTDPEQFDPYWLEMVRGRPLGEFLPVPDEFVRERRRNGYVR